MSAFLTTETHKVITLTEQVRKGGEAAIYRVAENQDWLAKVYHSSKQETLEKISWMIANPPDDPVYRKYRHRSFAWPEHLLFDPQQRFVGFLMPRIRQAAPLIHLSNPVLRDRTELAFNRLYLHRVAYNLSTAIDAVHKKKYIIGDLNQQNVLFNLSALVTLIDNDSFQVTTNDKTFRCYVGVPEYTAPEIQNVYFAHCDRNVFHDSFALAVIIFQLLMNGNHPFRSMWLAGGEPPTLAEKIIRGLFPYGRPASFPAQPPPDGPPLETLDPEIAQLFLRCFIDGHARPDRRPLPREWASVLETTENRLIQCPHCGDFFYRHLQSCPWCRR